MNHFYRLLFIFFISFFISLKAFGYETITLTRQDHKSVPLTVYSPGKNSCQGIAVISPGAGGSEKGYSYLGDAMSSQGYLTVVVGHQESGWPALKQKMRQSGLREGLSELITDPNAYRGRFMDIAAAKRWAQEHCVVKGSVLIGHSMGAATTMMEAGAKNNLGVTGQNTFDIYIALSPQGVGSIFPENAWREISKPVLSITGTRDSELGGTWEKRLEPFNNMPQGCKWQGIIKGATHMNFAGIGLSRNTENLTIRAIQDFLSGVHQHNCKAPPRQQGIEIKVK